MKNYRDRIHINPNIRSGKPCIVNTHIAVSDVFDYLGGGMSVEEVLDGDCNFFCVLLANSTKNQ
nr:DUF433 domain-containing protein [Pseudanabaena sp. 'Roaring Creek']